MQEWILLRKNSTGEYLKSAQATIGWGTFAYAGTGLFNIYGP